MISIYGIFGFIGFEALKVYKRLWDNKKIIKKKHLAIYIVILVIIALLSGFVAYQLAKDNPLEALFIGFSVPTSLKSIIEPRKQTQSIEVEDIVLSNSKHNLFTTLFYKLYLIYFSFRYEE